MYCEVDSCDTPIEMSTVKTGKEKIKILHAQRSGAKKSYKTYFLSLEKKQEKKLSVSSLCLYVVFGEQNVDLVNASFHINDHLMHTKKML